MNKLILLILLCICLILFIITEKFNNIDQIEIDSGKNGPILLLLGGTHGNEPAGSIALEKILMSNLNLIKGKIIIIPRVNKLGLILGQRWGFNGFIPIDYNRNYPTFYNEYNSLNKINNQIIKLVNQSDFIIDIHEGWGWNKIQSNSLGSGLYSSNTLLSNLIGNETVKKLNEEIFDNNKKFSFSSNNKEIDGTLSLYCKNINKNYILIETTGQNNIQPLNLRVEQINFIILNILNKLKMI
jgi:hypothetical protein